MNLLYESVNNKCIKNSGLRTLVTLIRYISLLMFTAFSCPLNKETRPRLLFSVLIRPVFVMRTSPIINSVDFFIELRSSDINWVSSYSILLFHTF